METGLKLEPVDPADSSDVIFTHTPWGGDLLTHRGGWAVVTVQRGMHDNRPANNQTACGGFQTTLFTPEITCGMGWALWMRCSINLRYYVTTMLSRVIVMTVLERSLCVWPSVAYEHFVALIF